MASLLPKHTSSILLGLSWAVLVTLLFCARLSLASGTYAPVGGTLQPFDPPMILSSAPEGEIDISMKLRLGYFHPTHLRILADDCLDSLVINGVAITDPQIPFCDFTIGRSIDLSHVLQRGDNTVDARIRNFGGPALLQITTDWSDATRVVPLALFLGLIVTSSFFLLKRTAAPPWVAAACWVMLAGILLRGWYFSITPYWVRGHDTDGHIEYIEYLMTHLSLPAPNAGWEFWQPPLYYTLGALWMKGSSLLGLSRTQSLVSVQFASFLLSIVTLGIALWIGLLLFKKRERAEGLPWLLAIFSFFPSLIFLSARINNDVLSIPLSFLAVALLLSWWQSPTRRTLLLASVIIGLTILTKSTGLLLVPFLIGCVVLRFPLRQWKTTATHLGLSLLSITLLSGWFSAYRTYTVPTQGYIIGNTDTLNSGLTVRNDFASLFTFHPVEILRIPFNNPWDDLTRRSNFWEYWFRSAMFGEFHFGDSRMLLASWLLLWWMLLSLVCVAGCAAGLRVRWQGTVPLLLLSLLLLAGHAAFRMKYPFGSSQDFRYSLLLLVPIAAFTARAILSLPTPASRRIAAFIAQLFCLFAAVFLLHA